MDLASDEISGFVGKFLLSIVILFLLFNFLLSFMPLEWFEFFYAFFSLEILKITGVEGSIEYAEPVILNISSVSMPIAFTYLCTGLLEISLVCSAVLSTHRVKIEKRIAGTIGAIAAIVIFNLARILASILIIIHFTLDAANFSHDILFRIFLFATISGYYFVWLNGAGSAT